MQETKLNDIKENIKALKDSPLYVMSLGGRELFHSNFWAWLIRQDTQFINVFFDGDFEGASITREEKHHDLTIRTKDEKTHIIENKIKSLATKEQLDRYLFDIFKSYIEIYKTIKNREDLKGKEHNEERAKLLKEPADILRSLYIALDGTAFSEDKKALSEKPKYINNIVDPKDDKNDGTAHAIKNLFVLTGLYKPDDDIERKSSIWKYVSYDRIADEIRNRLDSSEIKDTYKEIVKEYCADVKKLSKVINSLLKDSGTDYTFAHAEQLKSIRFDDTYKKLKMEHFANSIDTKEIGKPQKSGFDLKTEVNFSNKKSDHYCKIRKNKKNRSQ